jgi:DNA-binding MarR family transcriptional regulator
MENRKQELRVMTAAGERLRPRANFVIEREKPMEPSVQNCLHGVGISLLSELDVLIFVYRHRASLTSADQIARLIGYESKVVSDVLDRLERKKLIERSRPSQGVCFYRILASMDAGHRCCLQQIISLSETRAGRLQLAGRLKTLNSDSGREEQAS